MIAISFGALTAYVPGVTGGSINTAWVFLSAVLPFTLFRKRRWSGAHVCGLVFILYATASIVFVGSPIDGGIETGWHLFILALAFLYGTTIRQLAPLAIGAACGLFVSDIVAVIQFSGYAIVQYNDRPAGLFINPMIFGWVSAYVGILLINERMWRWLPIILPGFIFGQSRGAMVVIGAYIIASSKLRFPMSTLLLLTVLFLLAVLKPSTLLNRLEVWMTILPHLTLWGHGIGSTETWLSAMYNANGNTAKFAHNDVLQYAFEFGFGALPLLAALLCAGRQDRDLYLSAICLVFLDHPLQIPATGFLIAVIVGYCSRVRTDDGDPSLQRRHLVARRLPDPQCGNDIDGGVAFPVQQKH